MQAIQKVVLNKALNTLNALKVDYVIVLPDGGEIIRGDIALAKKEKKLKRKHEFAPGTFSNMYRELGVHKMEVGDVHPSW